MADRSASQVRSMATMAKKVAAHHFGKTVKKVAFKPTGQTNFVFEVLAANKNYIVRISEIREKINDYIKEQWAVKKVEEKGVPVAEILEVGNEVIPHPYMLQEKRSGAEGVDHPNRAEILKALGKYAKIIHSIPTTGYGQSFDWTNNKLSKKKSWSEFLDKELGVPERLQFLRKQRIISKRKLDTLAALFKRISGWKMPPSLNHGDLRLKNVIVGKDGKIDAIIDWDNCSSNIAPYWDFSIALHDLSIDNKQKFLEGYGLDFQEFERMSYAMKAFNLINYVPSLQRIVESKDKVQLEFYKLRLNGDLDLFSL